MDGATGVEVCGNDERPCVKVLELCIFKVGYALVEAVYSESMHIARQAYHAGWMENG